MAHAWSTVSSEWGGAQGQLLPPAKALSSWPSSSAALSFERPARPITDSPCGVALCNSQEAEAVEAAAHALLREVWEVVSACGWAPWPAACQVLPAPKLPGCTVERRTTASHKRVPQPPPLRSRPTEQVDENYLDARSIGWDRGRWAALRDQYLGRHYKDVWAAYRWGWLR